MRKKRISFHDNPILQRSVLPVGRSRFLKTLFLLGFVLIAGRTFYLQAINEEFLQREASSRSTRTIAIPASRGVIVDRNNQVVATSIPAKAIWVSPQQVNLQPNEAKEVARLLDMTEAQLTNRINNNGRNFVYLKHQVSVDVAEKIKAMKLAGFFEESESLRTYPNGEVFAHIVGFTNFEDKGQEGVEFAYDNLLSGQPGSRRIIRDRLGRVIDSSPLKEPAVGTNLTLSVDSRIQSYVYTELENAVKENQAKGGAAIVLDSTTGEVLALVNYPTYDPNNRQALVGSALRNRALTDTFEPGSTIKPMSVATALDLGRITPQSSFDTGNGRYQYAGSTITDVSNHNGVLDVTGILRRSSNIGMTMISQRLESKEMWDKFNRLGFGRQPQLNFPGTVAGRLRPWERWKPIEKATMSYGYGLSLSLVQLAQAYTAFARNGDVVNLSLLKREPNEVITSSPVYSQQTALTVRGMLEAAAGPDGASLAQVSGYRVAGKSGTARKIINGTYSTSQYVASFVGLAPVSNPKIVVAVMIDEPAAGRYYGGRVAAPVFSSIVSGTLSTMQIPPDAPFQSVVLAEEQRTQGR